MVAQSLTVLSTALLVCARPRCPSVKIQNWRLEGTEAGLLLRPGAPGCQTRPLWARKFTRKSTPARLLWKEVCRRRDEGFSRPYLLGQGPGEGGS